MSLKFPLLSIMLYLSAGLCAGHSADCTISLSQTVVDYQRITPTYFAASHGRWNALDKKEVIVSTQCSEPVQITNLFSAAGAGKKFTFGEHSQIAVVASDAYLDGSSVSLGKDSSQGAFTPKQSTRKSELIFSGSTLVPVRDGKVPFGQHLIYRLTIKPLINDVELHARDINRIESDMNISLAYQ